MRLLSRMLTSVVRKGRLTLIDADGTGHEFGSGRDGPDVTMRLRDKALYWKLVINPELYAAEA